LQENSEILPIKSINFIKYMIEHNILYNYQFENGIEIVLKGMNQRTKGKSQMDLAIEDLKLFHQDFENDFLIFFEDLQNHSIKFLKNYSIS
jgi:acyl carrier protein phosphodiesterase